MSEGNQFVTLGIAGEIFAAPVEQVQEILEMRAIARLPQAPPHLLGIIDVRSQSVPVLDLRLTLGLPVGEDTENTRIIVLKLKIDGQERTVGIRTDQVYEVTVLDDGPLDPAPQIGTDWKTQAIVGIGRRRGAFVTVLNLDWLFSTGHDTQGQAA